MTNSRNDLSVRIAAGQRAVQSQTGLLHREFGKASSSLKTDGTRVTPVDIAISENIFAALRVEFPDDDYFSEEQGETVEAPVLQARFAWVLDPIDGTNNFATGIAECAISLGLFENGVPVYGIIYDHARRVLMHGGPGFGVFDGDREAGMRREPPGAHGLIGFHTPSDSRYAPHAEAIVREFKIRGLGSSTLHLAYVAAGLLDGTVDHNVKIWDIAAAVPLVWAAGGKVEFLNGELFPLRSFDLRMPRIFYVSGSAELCARLRTVLGVPASDAPSATQHGAQTR